MNGNVNGAFQEDEFRKIKAMQDQRMETFDSAQKKGQKKLDRQKRKLSVQSKIKEYKDSFTVHGLTRSLTRDNKCEAIFWTVVLLGGIALSAYIVEVNVRKYSSYHIFSQIHEDTPKRNYYPSVTFCEYHELVKLMFSYCGELNFDKFEVSGSSGCKYNQIPEYTNATITTDNKKFWTNGKFEVHECGSFMGESCLNSKYLRSSQLFNHSCVTWNYNGDYYNLKSSLARFSFSFFQNEQSFNSSPIEIVAFPHESGILYVDWESNIHIGVGKETTMVFDKTVVKRLPHPYPSNCSYEKMNDILPGKYARGKCIESNLYIQMYKKCGDTTDFMRQYIPADIKKEYTRNVTMLQAALCIGYFKLEAEGKCVFPCEYQDIGVTHSAKELPGTPPPGQNKTWYKVSFRNLKRYTHKVLEEKVLYSWQQMLSEIGGFIGLTIGASIISVFEIFTYLFLRASRMY